MCEMLGNQYFMTRNYLAAVDVFEKVLLLDPNNSSAKKKLIVSLTQTGKHDRAAELFFELIEINPDVIINTDIIKDDCPCPELTYKLENLLLSGNKSFTTLRTLGILWLYCDLGRSIDYFEDSLKLKPEDKHIKRTLSILNKKLSELNKSPNSDYYSY